MSVRGRLDPSGLPGPEEIADAPATPPTRGRRRGGPIAVAAVAVALVLTALAFYRWGSARADTVAARPSASPSATKAPTTAQVYSAVAPSTVSITATNPAATAADSGAGIVVNADGTILTALHVVKGAGAIRVTFADGTTSAATVSSADQAIDIATLAPATLPSVVVPAVLGRSDRLAVGDSVLAIGDPLGLTRTATTGVVSGLNRHATVTGGPALAGLIQFDAAVNPGSSGGPLVDGKGQTVGIVVALANPTDADTFVGVGFAVPITTAVAGGGGARVPEK